LVDFGELTGAFFTLFIVLLAFTILANAVLPKSVRTAAGRAVGRVIGSLSRFVWRLVLATVSTIIDFLVTAALAAYHVASLRPWLVGDDWMAFLHRSNDRLTRIFTP
jgi:hypothetical protein